MIEIHIAADGDFEDTQSELNKFYVEAKDNVRFLSTLERHFKNITYGTTFQVVTETIPSMMNALRMVWIISRHYNKDERMVPLMERIAWELAERVARVINVQQLYDLPPEEVKQRTSEAAKMLTTWQDVYLEVRQKIENSGRDQRWEFDRKKLFERTDYMKTICLELHEIAQVLEDFYIIFGPEQKAVTGDPGRIEEVILRVDQLVDPIKQITFDALSLKDGQQWKILITNFHKEVTEIENEAKAFIDESFKSVRSAEGAFDMLLNFKHLRSREAINNQMMQKFKDILVQYGKEVDTMDQLFKEFKEGPPLNKNYPPIAGSIFWTRSLFHRIKHTVIRFQTLEEMIVTDMGKTTRSKYLSVARNMRAFEDSKYELWKENVESTLPGLLKRNLLVKRTPQVSPTAQQASIAMSALGRQQMTGTLWERCKLRLAEIIAETKYVESLGFTVPELARNVALQEEKYIRYVDGLSRMLHRYHAVLASLDYAEATLLEDHKRDLRRMLRPGSKRLNWNSLGINDYIAKCDSAIAKFESLVHQIQKNARDINQRLSIIEHANLFKTPKPKYPGHLHSCKEYFEYIEQERVKDLEIMAANIEPLDLC